MLLGNWDGGMFPGQPRRQKAIVQPRSDGCSPRASRSCQSQQPPQAQEVAQPVSEEHRGAPSGSPKLVGCSSMECPSQSTTDTAPIPPKLILSIPGDRRELNQTLNQTLLALNRGDGQGQVPQVRTCR